ncbi:MAG: HlyD family efflux transporter periplasmic adaptor subunit [Chitinophagales bacterium]
MSSEADKIELRSEEVQEILGKVPSWVTRWGISVIFIVIVGLLIIAAIVKYPNLVEAQATLTTETPPVPIITKIGGKIEQLNIASGEEVSEGDVLVVLENTANEEQLFLIESKLDSFINGEAKSKINFPVSASLGSLQDDYSDFLMRYKDFNFHQAANVSASSIAIVQTQIGELNNINENLAIQWQNCQGEMSLSQTNWETDKNLYNQGIISLRDLQEKETIYLQKKSACESIQIQVANNQAQIQALRMDVFDFSSQNQATEFTKYTNLLESANQLKSEILLWKEQYFIIAPTDGIVTLNNIWSVNQYVESNQEILSIVQVGQTIKTTASLNNQDIGKVKVGQKVIISFAAYSYMEYGYVNGVVASISPIPRDNMYQIEIALDNDLNTTYDKELPFTQGMLGNAEIITEKRTILDRIFDKLRYVFEEKY